jgi:hypothetical protein
MMSRSENSAAPRRTSLQHPISAIFPAMRVSQSDNSPGSPDEGQAGDAVGGDRMGALTQHQEPAAGPLIEAPGSGGGNGRLFVPLSARQSLRINYLLAGMVVFCLIAWAMAGYLVSWFF